MFQKIKLINSNLLKLFLYSLLFLFSLFFLPDLYSKTTCEGSTCHLLPQKYRTELDNIDTALRFQYLEPVMQSIVESAIISNHANSLIGAGYVNRFQIGAGIGAGGVKKNEINYSYGDIYIPKLPNFGISASPSVMGAINIGWLMGHGPSLDAKKKNTEVNETNEKKENDSEEKENEEEKDPHHFLHRFNLYVHGMRAGYNLSEMKAAYGDKPELSGGVRAQNFGATIRFNLLEPYFTPLGLFGFTGISIGLGYHYQSLAFDLSHQPRQNPTLSFGDFKGVWIARTEAEFSTAARSTTLDIRGGIRLFYFFDLYTGFGISRNTAQANLFLQRSGPLQVSGDVVQTFNNTYQTSDYFQHFNGINVNPNGNLKLEFREKRRLTNSLGYLILGTEIKFFFLKLLAEGIILENSYGASLGAKIYF
jgi:hypothetical protein